MAESLQECVGSEQEYGHGPPHIPERTRWAAGEATDGHPVGRDMQLAKGNFMTLMFVRGRREICLGGYSQKRGVFEGFLGVFHKNDQK